MPKSLSGWLDYRTFATRICGDHYIVRRYKIRVSGRLSDSTGCVWISPRIDGMIVNSSSYLTGCGGFSGFDFSGQGLPYGTFTRRGFEYLKLGDCVMGQKYDVLKLDVGTTPMTLNAITVAPNPANHEIYLHYGQNKGEARVRLYNLLGSCVRSVEMKGTELSIPAAELSSGLYFLEVSDSRIRSVSRVVVQH
jgi:hypothetical protein